MSLTLEDVRKILEIIEDADCEEVRIEYGDFKLHMRRHGGAPESVAAQHQPLPDMPARAAREEAPAKPAPASKRDPVPETVPQGVVAVRAPMLGTFYRASAPGEKPFVEPGDAVAPDDTICLLEVMKLFNSVKAGVAGTVEKILVENGSLVAHGQPLILIRSVEDEGAI